MRDSGEFRIPGAVRPDPDRGVLLGDRRQAQHGPVLEPVDMPGKVVDVEALVGAVTAADAAYAAAA